MERVDGWCVGRERGDSRVTPGAWRNSLTIICDGERWRGRAGGSGVPADARVQSGVPGRGPG